MHTGTGPAPGTFGAPCATDDDCDDHLCVKLASGSRVCSKTCDDASQCAVSWTCDPEPNIGNACKCAATGPEVCDGIDNDCNTLVDEGATCPGGNVCMAGQCVCPPERVCNGACIDPSADDLNCGGCGIACGPGTKCQAGMCACVSPCGSACPDFQTDPAHCGVCDHACSAGCSGGHCLPSTLLPAEGVGRVTLDSGDVYVTISEAAGTSLLKLTGGAGTPKTIINKVEQIYSFSFNATHVFWTDVPSVSNNALFKTPKNGGATSTIAYQDSISAVGAGSNQVYFSYGDTTPRIAKVSTNGGTPTVVQSVPGGAWQILVDGSDYYWVTNSKLSKNSQTLASGLTAPGMIAFDATHVYYTNEVKPTSLRRVPKAGGSPEELAAGITISGAAFDGTDLYWTDRAAGTISKIPAGGGQPTLVSSGHDEPGSIAVDATRIFFRTKGGLQVLDK